VFTLGDEAVQTRITEGLDTGGWRSDRRCLPGTRQRYIARIWAWVRSSDEPRLCWLNGVAGSGKSSISHELVAMLHAKRRPYSCFFFRHDDAPLAMSAVTLLAYGLSFVSGLRELIVQALERSNNGNSTIEEQFMALIVTPLQEFASICPSSTIVLVIDGMDECPDDIRPSFLAAIRSGIPHLPSTVKVFLSSRAQDDVRGVIETLQPLKKISLAAGAGKDDGDIERFLQHELQTICKAAGLEHTWTASQIEKDAGVLASKASGLFQCAQLSSLLLINRPRPREIIARISSVEMRVTPEDHLDALYTEALNIALPAIADDKDLASLYRRVLGTVMAAKQPLTVSAICELLEPGGNGADANVDGAIRVLVENLGFVLVVRRIRGGAIVVRTAHSSFCDYVTSRERCPSTWFIDLHHASVQLGSDCFSLMETNLRRDICGLRSPSLTNKDVTSEIISRHITTGLRYACTYAFTHISGDSGNQHMLEAFLMEKLLEWLEVMSLLNLLDAALELLQHTLADLDQVCVAISSAFPNPLLTPLSAFPASKIRSRLLLRSSKTPYGLSVSSGTFSTRARYTRISLHYLSRHRVQRCTECTQHDIGTSPASHSASTKHGLKSCVRFVTWAVIIAPPDVSLFQPTLLSPVSLLPPQRILSWLRQLPALSSRSTGLGPVDLRVMARCPLLWRANQHTWHPSLPASCSRLLTPAHPRRPNYRFHTMGTGCHRRHFPCRSRALPSIKTSMPCWWDVAMDKFSYGGCATRPGSLTTTSILILTPQPCTAWPRLRIC
jgi:NACHT domain